MADFSLGEAVLGTSIDLEGLKSSFSQAEMRLGTGRCSSLAFDRR